jgi:hypothetical protein
MSRSHASQIDAATSALIVKGDLGAIGEFFSPDYVATSPTRTWQGGRRWSGR